MIPAAILELVPGGERGAAIYGIRALGAGTVNRSFLVQTRAGRFVVRLERPATEVPGIDRERERLLHGCAASAGLAPELCSAGAGFTVTRFVEGRALEPEELARPEGIAALGAALGRLHTIAVPALEPFDALAAARAYVARIEAREPGAASMLERELESIASEVERSCPAERRCAIVHLDLHHSNVIAGERTVLLDWEFSRVGDPLLDLACWVAYYPAARAQAPLLLERSGLQRVATVAMLESLGAAFKRLTALWYRALG